MEQTKILDSRRFDFSGWRSHCLGKQTVYTPFMSQERKYSFNLTKLIQVEQRLRDLLYAKTQTHPEK